MFASWKGSGEAGFQVLGDEGCRNAKKCDGWSKSGWTGSWAVTPQGWLRSQGWDWAGGSLPRGYTIPPGNWGPKPAFTPRFIRRK